MIHAPVSAQTDGYHEGIMWILLNNPGKGDEAIQRAFSYPISKQEAKSIMAETVQYYAEKGEKIRQKEKWLDKGVKVSSAIANSKLIKANDIALAILAPGLGISGIASAKTNIQAIRALISSQAALASLTFKAASWMEQLGAWRKGKEPNQKVLKTLDRYSNNSGRISTFVGFNKPSNLSEVFSTTHGVLSDPTIQQKLKGEEQEKNALVGNWSGHTWCANPKKNKYSFRFGISIKDGVIKCNDYSSSNIFKPGKLSEKSLQCSWYRKNSNASGTYNFYLDKKDKKLLLGHENTKDIKCKLYKYELRK